MFASFTLEFLFLANIGGRPSPLNPLIVRGSTREVCVSGGGGAKGGQVLSKWS